MCQHGRKIGPLATTCMDFFRFSEAFVAVQVPEDPGNSGRVQFVFVFVVLI